MSKQSFDGEQVRTVFIKVCAKGVPERMAGETFFPAKTAFVLMDVSGKEKSVNGSGRVEKSQPVGRPY